MDRCPGSPTLAGVASASVILVVVTMTLLLSTSAWALGPGSPPRVSFAAVWVNTFSTNAFISSEEGAPQLYVSVTVEIPGGNVPANVSSVTVTLPGGLTTLDVPKATDDLFVDLTYFRNLSAGGSVAGLPTGTYTFTVTDTAGGVTTVTDAPLSTAGIAPSATITVSGAPQVSLSPGEQFVLDLSVNPRPTITWAPVAGAAFHRLRIRPFSGPEVFVHTITSGPLSSTLPAGVLVPGRLYRVVIESETSASGLPASDARSRRELRLTTLGPELSLSSSGGTGVGQTLTISARVTNTGPPVVVSAFGWLGFPDGRIDTIIPPITVSIPNSAGLPNNDFFNGPIFTKTMTASDPNGNYIVGVRLIDPATHETIALQTLRLQK